MEMEMVLKIEGGTPGAEFVLDPLTERNGVFFANVTMKLAEEAIPDSFRVLFKIPIVDCYSVWSPYMRQNRYLGPEWSKTSTTSRFASGMPLHSILSNRGANRLTIALSDTMTPISIATGVCEMDACLSCVITFFTEKVAPMKEYQVTIRLDRRDIPYYDSIYDTVTWWENVCGYPSAPVPEYAKRPMNSLWYSYHKELIPEDILKECALSKPFGMDTVIIDDGWQTNNINSGYAYCGDWELASEKIPDMKAFVDHIHKIGMKVILWFSVPYVGIYAKNYERFKDKLLAETDDNGTYWALDPRYKEVRDFLISTYVTAVSNWGLDGLKLDFIDSFALKGKSLEYDPRRDYQSLEEAIDHLLNDTTKALRAIRPDIMIEFRQSYVGPAIRKYGSMLRVTDCPADPLVNRLECISLRLTSGKTAVHSDMLMWNYDDTVESAALQCASILYSVPQISVKIAKLNEKHRKMLSYYLAFWREHREILLDGKLRAENPEALFSLVWAEKDGKAIFTAYTNPVIDCTQYHETIVVNATSCQTLILKGAQGKTYTTVNCMGETISQGKIETPLCEIDVPLAGMIYTK